MTKKDRLNFKIQSAKRDKLNYKNPEFLIVPDRSTVRGRRSNILQNLRKFNIKKINKCAKSLTFKLVYSLLTADTQVVCLVNMVDYVKYYKNKMF